MAQNEILDRIANIIDHLSPLAQKERGMPLVAADWNTLVGGILELARLTATREKSTEDALSVHFSRKNHQHPGEVSLSWMDEGTRSVLEARSLADNRLRSEVGAVRDQYGKMARQLSELEHHLKKLEVRLQQVNEADTAREDGLGRLGLRMESLKGMEGEFAGIRTEIGKMDERVRDVLGFREQLVDDAGRPIDMAAVTQRLQGLESLRSRLVTADGEVVLIRDMESRLANLEKQSISHSDLDAAILERLEGGGLLDTGVLAETMMKKMDSHLAPAWQKLDDRLLTLRSAAKDHERHLDEHSSELSKLSGRAANLESQVSQVEQLRAKMTEMGRRQANMERVTSENTAAIKANSALAGHLREIEAWSRDTNNRLNDMEKAVNAYGELAERLKALESLDLEARLSELNSSVATLAALHRRLQSLEERNITSDDSVKSLEERVTVAEAQVDDLSGVSDRVNKLESGLSSVRTTLRSVSGLPDTMTGLYNRLSSLARSMSALDEQVSKLEPAQFTERLEMLESSVSNLDRLSSSIKILSSRINEVEEKIR